MGDHLLNFWRWLQNAAQQAAIAESPSVMTAAGQKINRKGKVEYDHANDADVKQLRSNLAAIGEAATTAPGATEGIEFVYNAVKHPIRTARVLKNIVKGGVKYATKQENIRTVAKEMDKVVDDNPILSAYSSNPRLMDAGTPYDYLDYTQSIFPESLVNGVYYHGGPAGISRFKTPTELEHLNEGINTATKDYGIYFTPKKYLAKIYAATSTKRAGVPNIYHTKLNIRSPYRYEHPSVYAEKFLGSQDLRFDPSSIDTKWYNKLGLDKYDAVLNTKSANAWDDGQVVILNPEDIHILGSNKDVSMFQNWKENPTYLYKPLDNLESIPNNPVQYDPSLRNYLKASMPALKLSSLLSIPVGGGLWGLYDDHKHRYDEERIRKRQERRRKNFEDK